MRAFNRRTLLGFALASLGGGVPAAAMRGQRTFEEMWGRGLGPPDATQRRRPRPQLPPGAVAAHRLRHWNSIAVDASGLDHTRVLPGESRVFGEQLGPGRSSRAMAIAHIAMFEAINAIDGQCESYLGLPYVGAGVSMDASIARAAHDTLADLYPSQAAHCQELLAEDLALIPAGLEKQRGEALGAEAAARILRWRGRDGAQHVEPLLNVGFFPGDRPGEWRQDPISRLPIALGARWGEVEPFVIPSAERFRVPPPPRLTSARYTAAFNEVLRLGGDGVVTPTGRTDEQTQIGIYWAYDGTPSLCAPPRLYNQIAMTIADQMGSDAISTARMLALVHTAMADAAIAIWESKYHYEFWRPVTGVREADPGTGPTGRGDGNPATIGDVTFSPLGAPASNLTGAVNFTPPFPAYPSGHAGFGGALFQILREFYGSDTIPFTFVSDELNGITRDVHGIVRPLLPRRFASLSDAEEENGQSRIYLGIHWEFDKTEGIRQGRDIAHYVFGRLFRPLRDV
jgi:hypothetical protein